MPRPYKRAGAWARWEGAVSASSSEAEAERCPDEHEPHA